MSAECPKCGMIHMGTCLLLTIEECEQKKLIDIKEELFKLIEEMEKINLEEARHFGQVSGSIVYGTIEGIIKDRIEKIEKKIKLDVKE